MEKTNIEKQYEKLIIQHIANINICPERRALLFYDFFQNSETYYEDLCDTLYCVSSGQLSGSLWMSQSGEIYASTHARSSEHSFLTDSSSLPLFQGDLLEHLEYIFIKIYSLVNRQSSRFCRFS